MRQWRQLATTLLILTLASTATAQTWGDQQHPSNERGFRADQLYQFNGFDDVNLFNGNLILTLPLGINYTVDSVLSYQFVLRYSGNVWHEHEFCSDIHDSCHLNYTLQQSDNAGVGWRLSFGELRAPIDSSAGATASGMWMYRSPDASEHLFFTTIHDCVQPGTPECENPVASLFYTRDGTYLRLNILSNTKVVIDFPSGEHQLYVSDDGTTWRLHYIYDAFATLDANNQPTTNYVKFENVLNTVGTNDVSVTDSHGRTHYVRFTADGKIDKLELAAFNGATGVYDLAYNQYVLNADGTTTDGAAETIAKPCYNSQSSTATAAARLLTRVATATAQTYTFSYNKGDMTACSGGSDLSANDMSGTLQSATLPTGGRLEWQYRNYNFATADSFDHAVGVYQRSAYDTTNTQEQQQQYVAATGASVVTKFVHHDADNTWQPQSQITNYFQTQLDLTGVYGLPFSTTTMTSPPNPDGSTVGRYLSSQTVECTPATGACASTPSRARYVKYEMDAVQSLCDPTFPCNRDRNRRVVSERTSNLSDAGRYVDLDYAAFDGLGHYRSTTKSGTMTTGTQVTYTNYNALVGTYNADGTGGFNSRQIPSTWLLNTYDTSAVSDGSHTAAQGFCFSVATGFLEQKWIYKADASLVSGPPSITRSAGDLLTRFDQTGGNITTERYFGGDIQDASQWALCSAPTASPRYQINRTYTFGSVATEQYNGAPFYTSNSTIDPNTGFVATSNDTAGVSTTYNYDLDGRIVAARPTGAAWTAYRYWRPGEQTTGAAAAVDVTDCGNGISTCASGSSAFLRQQRVEFDAFGRVAREKRLLATGQFNTRETKYDALGRKSFVSEVVEDNGTSPTVGTSFTYDAFDRPLTIKPADGDAHTITFGYTGARIITRTEHVATTFGGEEAQTTTKAYDDQQRLLSVMEPNGTTTAYTYHVSGHLATATMTSGTTQQLRTFTYDNRGFLTSEQQPENGLTTYTGYDARGHLGSRLVTDPSNQCNGQIYRCFDLQYAYDNAERMQSVQSRNPWDSANFRPFKEFTYDTPNSSGSKSTGKLSIATRHNYDPIVGETIVSESYDYNDTAGHLTDKTTVVGPNGTLDKTFKQHYDYNDLGTISQITYPWCADDAGCGYGTAWPSVTEQYTNGELSSSSLPTSTWAEPANTITYWPSGMVHTVTHGNSVTDTYDVDLTTMMARPSAITFGNWATCAPPSINSQSGSSTIYYNSQQTLTVSATGNGISYQWYQGLPGDTLSPISGATGSQYTTPALPQTSNYWVLVSNPCGHVNSAGVTVNVQLRNPTNLIATRAGTTSTISITWQQSNGATSYTVYRRSGPSFIQAGTSTSTTFQESVALEAAYIYQVTASGYNVLTSPPSTNDIANTLTFTGVTTNAAISFMHFEQLRTSVNAVRAAWGDAALSWSDILNTSMNPCAYGTVATLPASGAVVYAAHVMRLRCAMDNALTRAGITPWSYTDPDLTNHFIRAIHVTDLQQRAQ